MALSHEEIERIIAQVCGNHPETPESFRKEYEDWISRTTRTVPQVTFTSTTIITDYKHR